MLVADTVILSLRQLSYAGSPAIDALLARSAEDDGHLPIWTAARGLI